MLHALCSLGAVRTREKDGISTFARISIESSEHNTICTQKKEYQKGISRADLGNRTPPTADEVISLCSTYANEFPKKDFETSEKFNGHIPLGRNATGKGAE